MTREILFFKNHAEIVVRRLSEKASYEVKASGLHLKPSTQYE